MMQVREPLSRHAMHTRARARARARERERESARARVRERERKSARAVGGILNVKKRSAAREVV